MHLSKLSIRALLLASVMVIGLLAYVFVVTDRPDTPKTIVDAHQNQDLISSCDQSPECFEEIILATIHEEGLAQGFKLLGEIYEQTPSFRSSCHGFSRQLTHVLYEQQPDYTQFTFTPESVICNYGFQQAYPEKLLLETADPQQAKQFCQFMMMSLRESVPGAEAECYRGIGRALPVIADAVQEAAAFTQSLAQQCDALTDNLSNYDACVNGVFNGLANSLIHNEDDMSENTEDPMHLCKELEGTLKDKCFSNYKSAALQVIDNRSAESIIAALPQIREFFASNTTDPAKDIVFNYGYLWAGDHLIVNGQIENAVAACTALPSDVSRYCFWGVSVGIVKFGTPDTHHELLASFCKSARESVAHIAPEDCPSFQAIGYLHGIHSEDEFNEIFAYLQSQLGTVVDIDNTQYYGF